ncbi:hypothetical protein PHAVU_010G027400 [Phaseolus vulgaris]|uniref:Uncharacterized protein n=1 Tax=Phaseolus vulgaris TaxID=3885 RepID=V7APR4_PHAVU|nr:hypothetical protein PHAVU_010G027400g [Phaseolus vulgaris]ESW06186.1 hypothetical protein PHAVU_010G027400g [Phaseolus vulgaris]
MQNMHCQSIRTKVIQRLPTASDFLERYPLEVLTWLKVLNLSHSKKMYKLKFLKTLIVSGCWKIDLMEKDIVRMKSLITIIAENTTVKQMPFSIINPYNFDYF